MAAFLAAPVTVAASGSASHDNGSPSFDQWLADAIALDERYARGRRTALTLEQLRAHEDAVTERMGVLCDTADALSAQLLQSADTSPRRVAMLVTLAVWSADKDCTNSFDYTAIPSEGDVTEATASALLKALGPFAAATLPEVPFGHRHGEGV